MTERLLIFIKNIEPGKVKTRLASTIGNEGALRVYRYLLEHTRKTALSIDADREVWYSSHVEEGDDWVASQFTKKVQHGADLGVRMESAFREAFEDGMERVVIIGSDCPELSQKHLNDAFQALKEHPAVIGPARDGGYYLLGLDRPVPELFQDKEWSTESVFADAVSTLRSLGLSFQTLDELSDVDYEEDLERLGLQID